MVKAGGIGISPNLDEISLPLPTHPTRHFRIGMLKKSCELARGCRMPGARGSGWAAGGGPRMLGIAIAGRSAVRQSRLKLIGSRSSFREIYKVLLGA